MADIEISIGDTGSYTLIFYDDNDGLVDVSAFTGGTITFTEVDTPSTAVASASLSSIGSPTTTQAVFSIPTSGFAVGDDEYHDYLAQIELTGSGTRSSFVYTCRVTKKLGNSG